VEQPAGVVVAEGRHEIGGPKDRVPRRGCPLQVAGVLRPVVQGESGQADPGPSAGRVADDAAMGWLSAS
jgi:hypothetical protein